MKRRDFLGLTGAAVAVLGPSTVSAQNEVTAPILQTEDGILIEDATDPLPENVPIRSQALHSTDDNRRRWALQHITELCKTQTISRGSGQVTILPRDTRKDINQLKVRDGEGRTELSKFLKDTSTDAFLVMHKGKIITEWYFNGMRPHTPHLIWSCSKSISAGVVANLLETETEFSRDSIVTKFIPQLKGCGYDGCTVDDLLNMRSSIKYRFGSDEVNVLRHVSGNECGRHYRSAEMYPRIDGDAHLGQYEFLRSLECEPLLTPHGSYFCYKDSDTAVLAWICEKLMGCRFVDLISELIWSQLGMEHDGSIICDPLGACTPAAGISITLRDFARWGQMHLRSGKWNGRQVVPANFIENVRGYRDELSFEKNSSYPPKDVLPPGTTYRDKFWVNVENKGAFHALGHCGQICFIHPESETVIVRFASAQELDPKYNEVLKAFADIVDYLGD